MVLLLPLLFHKKWTHEDHFSLPQCAPASASHMDPPALAAHSGCSSALLGQLSTQMKQVRYLHKQCLTANTTCRLLRPVTQQKLKPGFFKWEQVEQALRNTRSPECDSEQRTTRRNALKHCRRPVCNRASNTLYSSTHHVTDGMP
jgi:hypothetical protein